MNESNERVIKDAIEVGEVSKIMEKVMKDKVEVVLNENQDTIDLIELDLTTLNQALESKDISSEDLEKIKSKIVELENEKKDLEAKSVKAYLVPLKYRDIRTIQTAITEAILHTQGMQFEFNTQIAMMIKEKQFMTVYLSLRKHSNYLERYYNSLDSIAKVSDKTIQTLYEVYNTEFEISEDEIKK